MIMNIERHLDAFDEIESVISVNYKELIKPYINNKFEFPQN